MRKKRKFYNGVVNHIYQKAQSGFNLFYCDEDRLVFYTIFSVCAKESSDLVVLGLCLMYDHFHSLIITERVESMSAFMDHCTSWFAKLFNESVGRKGRLFRKNYGSAPKWGAKKVHSAIAYHFNNPVEKLLCKRAEDYRWSFLPYCKDRNPFSKHTPPRNASSALRHAKKEVQWKYSLNEPVNYQELRRFRTVLLPSEWEELVDWIIVIYNPFDYKTMLSYYDSYDDMLIAINSNTGGEFDLKEEFNDFSDLAYGDILEYFRQFMHDIDIRQMITWPQERKCSMFYELKRRTSAADRQLYKFLHLFSVERK